ncbi:MAG: glutamate-5-semialdehyde dehydrogenase [Candidatus Obscuribacter sp.]|nr:glutamate-5-semialdehyde dehydrogenase [Candidatus Obscuribacter sp.]MBP7576630.1 glutamate-5-semialdehyde dehydrogenase [Candidatus Obscuribacter sp.]
MNKQNTLDKIDAVALATRTLAMTSGVERNSALRSFIEQLQKRAGEIYAANKKDLEQAQSDNVEASLIKRLKFDQAKLSDVIKGIETLIAMDDPIGSIDLKTELDDGLILERVTVPIGVIAVIFESRPDALPQIAALALKSANGALLKGGREALTTNTVIFEIFTSAIGSVLPAMAQSYWLLSERSDVELLLGATGKVDLIIPRGSNSLVSYIQSNTQIPVLGHAEGICHVYVDKSADPDKACNVVVDSKITYPAACNAAETLLWHKDLSETTKVQLLKALRDNAVELRVCPRTLELCLSAGIEAKAASLADFATEYSALTMSVKEVDSLEDAIDHIYKYGSDHTDSIVTEDDNCWQRFFAQLKSASIYLNASTRFADGFRYGFGAEVGISTGHLAPRGPVGLEGLLTYKYRLCGQGHGVAPYSAGQPFKHRRIVK